MNCWICKRTIEELIKESEKLGYGPVITEKNIEAKRHAVLTTFKFFDEFELKVCVFCSYIIEDKAYNDLLRRLENGEMEIEKPERQIITLYDLKNLKITGRIEK